jgi:hypothetical protein
MTMLKDAGTYGRVMAWIGAAGLGWGVIAFIPSPLGLLDAFDAPQKLDIKKHPPLRLQAMPALATYEEIVNRPLFNPDRVPDPVVAATPGAGPSAGGSSLGDISQFRLVGIAGDSVTRLALVQKSGGSLMTLKPGDSLDGWTITDISAKGVAISGGGRREFLTIPRAPNNAKTP